jgi:hypothetical protein
MDLPDGPAILLLGISPKEIKTYIHAKTSTWIFINVSLIKSQKLKRTQMPFIRKTVVQLTCGTPTPWNTSQQ